MSTRLASLKRILEETHRSFLSSHEVQRDALAPALEYSQVKDKEFAAFLCASLAYGRVEHIQKSCRKILQPLGAQPLESLLSLTPSSLSKMTKNWSHRFNSGADLHALLLALQNIYRNHTSLENWLSPQPEETARSLIERLSTGLENLARKRQRTLSKSFSFLLPRPSEGSACKRMNLFLRWMVGKSEMDLTLWKHVHTRQLVVPVDTHLLRQAQKLRLTKYKAATWKAAEDITAQLRKLDPEDPTRFDFALCHLGIRGIYLNSKDIQVGLLS